MLNGRRARTGRLGQTMVEFALGLPVLLLLLVGVVEMSRMVLAYSVVNNIAREGALYAAATTTIAPPPLPGSPPTDTSPDQPTWWQTCNRGRNVRSTSGLLYRPYTWGGVNDIATCVGWPNVVTSVLDKAQGVQLNQLYLL